MGNTLGEWNIAPVIQMSLFSITRCETPLTES
jgi:hypothetical protein